jgi:hypothetical protein
VRGRFEQVLIGTVVMRQSLRDLGEVRRWAGGAVSMVAGWRLSHRGEHRRHGGGGHPESGWPHECRVDSGCDVLVLGLLVGARLGDSTVELTDNPTPDQQRALDALLRTPSDAADQH